MLRKGIFRSPKITLEGNTKQNKKISPDIPEELCVACPSCRKMMFTTELDESLGVCTSCGHHLKLNARKRILLIADEGSFFERDYDITANNRLDFPGYDKKLKSSIADSGECEAVVTGTCRIGGITTALFVMEPYFMMGSMGSAVGEKLTRLFEYATEHKLPVVGYCVSGGARMQEGIISLMQMAKVSGAVKLHSDSGQLYVCVLTDPTTGGVTASFAMQGDIILAEPGALVGFAGPRVIEQTIRRKLPEGFQRAEYLLRVGFVDDIVERANQKPYLQKLLSLHGYKEGNQ